MKKTLFITDDHSMIRNGIALWFNSNTEWECIGSAGSMEETIQALKELSQEDKLPSILLSDINMKSSLEGFELISEVKKMYPDIKAVAYSMYASPGIVQKALKAGAAGYISKTSDEKELFHCVEEVYSGKDYIGQELVNSLCSYNNVISSLTKRELQIFELILQRKTNVEISDLLNIKKHAVENYISFIYEKTGCSDRNELQRKFGEKTGENS